MDCIMGFCSEMLVRHCHGSGICIVSPAMQNYLRQPRRKWKRLFIALLAIFIVGNVIAYMQAYTMTHFLKGGRKTPRAEDLTFCQKAVLLFTGASIPKPGIKQYPSDRGMAFTNIVLKTGDGLKIAAWQVPSDVQTNGIILMFHGYKACKYDMLEEAGIFHSLGWDLLMVDFRASGESDGYTTTIGVKETTEVKLAYEWARANYKDRPIIIFGVSMGGVAALNAISRKMIKPDGIILECPFNTFLKTVKNRFELLHAPSFPAAQMLMFWGGVQHKANYFRHNPVEYASEVYCPALVMQGTDDPRSKEPDARAVYDNLAGSKTYTLFQGVKHESYAGRDPEKYRTTVSNWFAANSFIPSVRD